MRRDIANARMGQLVGADWRTYSLTTNRIEPAEVEASAAGTVTAGRWESPDGSLAVVLVRHEERLSGWHPRAATAC